MDVFVSKEPDEDGLTSIKDYIAFICFPISTIIGLLIAFKWEGLGG